MVLLLLPPPPPPPPLEWFSTGDVEAELAEAGTECSGRPPPGIDFRPGIPATMSPPRWTFLQPIQSTRLIIHGFYFFFFFKDFSGFFRIFQDFSGFSKGCRLVAVDTASSVNQLT